MSGNSLDFAAAGRRRGRGAAALVAVAAFAAAITSAAAEPRVVRSGVATAVLGYGSYQVESCWQGPLPVVRVARPPSHGTVEIGRGTQPNRSPNCAGRQIPGVVVIYRSQAGYRGPDSFSVDVETDLYVGGRGTRGDYVTIDLVVK